MLLKEKIMICPSCKNKVGCKCSLRRASDGTQCCTKCIAAYEAKLKQLKLKRWFMIILRIQN